MPCSCCVAQYSSLAAKQTIRLLLYKKIPNMTSRTFSTPNPSDSIVPVVCKRKAMFKMVQMPIPYTIARIICSSSFTLLVDGEAFLAHAANLIDPRRL
jgi:hypothetical protein